VAARRRTPRACGGDPLLAAAHAEALPLADGAVSGVISLDVIEHVAEPRRYLREIERVLAPGGNTALSTPNRFSLAAEPHVFVWGGRLAAAQMAEGVCSLAQRQALQLRALVKPP